MNDKKTANVTTGLRLQVIRSVLFIPPSEASSMFRGITLDDWSAMESGEVAVPPEVLQKFDSLFTWRNHQLAISRQMIESNPNCQLSEFWHATMDDWMAIDEREPEHFRVSQSLSATLAIEFPSHFKLYPFDLTAFSTWAMGRPATDELQAEYLAFVSDPSLHALPGHIG